MSAAQYVTVTLLSAVATAATYVMMHTVVGPHLPTPAVDVPQVVGLTPEQGRALAEPLGLMLILDGQREPESDKTAPGTLFEQKPLPGSRMPRGGELHATIALAVQRVQVPSLLGQPLAAAQGALTAAGLRAGTVTDVVPPAPAPGAAAPAVGTVLATNPPAGTPLKRGEAVELQVAKGAEQIAVPSLRSRSPGSARQALEQLGLLLGDVRKGVDDNADDGVIIRQSPAAGTQVARGTKVDITVNE